MKITVTKEWFRSRSHLEEGLEIGAGTLQSISKPVLEPEPPMPLIDTINISFGKIISLMRRKNHWTIDSLAKRAEATREELVAIENDPQNVPELSTVIGLAELFKLSPKLLLRKSGLATSSTSRLNEDSLRYATCSEFTESLSPDEEHILQAVLKTIVEKSDQQ
jgi:DNA-binding XRE family transcriptional regulator